MITDDQIKGATQDEEEGIAVHISWVVFFAFSVAIAAFSKVLWMFLGLYTYRRIIIIDIFSTSRINSNGIEV